MKRIITALSILLIALTAACSDDDPGDDSNDDNANETTPDAGFDDAGAHDTDQDDVGQNDTGQTDAGEDDAGETDLDFASVMDPVETEFDCSNGYCHGGSIDPLLTYDNLVDVESNCDGTVRVVPGDAEASLLWQKVSPEVDEADVCGEKMPPNAGPIDAEMAQELADWIDAGAPN